MVSLRKVRFGFAPLFRHVHDLHFNWTSFTRISIPSRVIHFRWHRLVPHVRYPHLLLGLVFLILLMAILFALPASASTQAPYLSVNDIPAQAPNLLVDKTKIPGNDAIPLPVTGQ